MIFKFKRRGRPKPTDRTEQNSANSASVPETDFKNCSMVSPDGNEKCVICGRDTGVPFSTPVSERKYYEPGSGQICESCYRRLYMPRTDSGRSFNREMEELIKMCGKKENKENFE